MTDLIALSKPTIRKPRKSEARKGAKRGRRKGSKSLITIERERRAEIERAKIRGQALAVDHLREIAIEAARGMARYRTHDDNEKPRKHGNEEKWFRFATLLRDVARYDDKGLIEILLGLLYVAICMVVFKIFRSRTTLPCRNQAMVSPSDAIAHG